MWRIQQQQFQVSRASSYKYSGGKPPSRWQEVPDWGDKLPRKASVQHYEPCSKHLSTGPPDQENTPISKSRLYRCFAKSNKKVWYNKEWHSKHFSLRKWFWFWAWSLETAYMCILELMYIFKLKLQARNKIRIMALTVWDSSCSFNGLLGRYVWFWRFAHSQNLWQLTGMPRSLATPSCRCT